MRRVVQEGLRPPVPCHLLGAVEAVCVFPWARVRVLRRSQWTAVEEEGQQDEAAPVRPP